MSFVKKEKIAFQSFQKTIITISTRAGFYFLLFS